MRARERVMSADQTKNEEIVHADGLLDRLKDFEFSCAIEELGVQQGLMEHRFQIDIACELDALGQSPRHAFDLLCRAGFVNVPACATQGSVREHFKVLDASPVESEVEDEGGDAFEGMLYHLSIELSYELRVMALNLRTAQDMVRQLIELPEQGERLEVRIERIALA